MKLHKSVVDKLLYIVDTYSGYEREVRLRKHIEAIDLTPYERKESSGEVILVLTEDYLKQLEGKR